MAKDFGIEVKGLEATAKELRRFAPDLYKELNRGVSGILARVQSKAKTVRSEGRFRRKVRTISSSYKGVFRPASGIVWSDVGPRDGQNDWSSPATRTVIFEKAAKTSSPQMQGAIDSFNARYGPPPRFLFRVFDEGEQRKAEAELVSVVRHAEDRFQERLESVGV